jgi:hypothetical protein
MNQPAGTSREDLYRSWFEWVTANLGRDNELAGIAATAAIVAVEAGRGFNTATESARAAWTEAAARRGLDRAGPASGGLRRWWSWRSFGCGVVLGIVIAFLVAIAWFSLLLGPIYGGGGLNGP